MTLAGRNGAGKTTLLRMLAGESVDRPRRAERGQGRAHRAARPAPAARARAWRCATTCSRAAPRSSRSRRELAELESAMAGGRERRGDARRATPARRRGWRRAAATCGATARRRWRTGWASRDDGPGPRARHVLRRRADARVARARAGRRAPTCCCSTSPPTTSTSSRWSGWSRRSSSSTPRSCSSRTTAGSWRRSARPCSSWRPGRSRFFAGTWHSWRTEQAAREIALGRGDRQAAGGDRAHGALRRALPLQGDEGAPGAVAREEAREDRADRARPARRQRAWGSPSRRPSAPGA